MGVPLRGGEEAILKQLGVLDMVSAPGSAEEGGRRYIDNDYAQLTTMLVRSTFIVGTELPGWADAIDNPYWEQSATAGAHRMLQNFSGFGKAYAFDPDMAKSYEVKRMESMLKDLMKERKRKGTAGFSRSR